MILAWLTGATLAITGGVWVVTSAHQIFNHLAVEHPELLEEQFANSNTPVLAQLLLADHDLDEQTAKYTKRYKIAITLLSAGFLILAATLIL